jgi:hypothetical protein
MPRISQANKQYYKSKGHAEADARSLVRLGIQPRRGEAHDDLCDGLTTLLQELVNQGLELPKIHWIEA